MTRPRFGDPTLARDLAAQLRVPVLAGPMFLVSSVDLVVAASSAGAIGSFPTLNARTPTLLDEWLQEISSRLTATRDAAPFAANLIVHASNARLAEDLEIVCSHRVPLVISSVGNPSPVVSAVHASGGHVFADAASIKHARRSAEAGADGLVLLCAGAGGHTGWLSPFAFVEEVRTFFDGPIALAGGMSKGHHILAAQTAGADFVLMGTRFLASPENAADAAYHQMVVDAGADDIVLTSEVTGLPANMLRASLEKAGFSRRDIPKFGVAQEEETLRAWRDVWGAGHGVAGVESVSKAGEVIDNLDREYQAAIRSMANRAVSDTLQH